MARKYLTEELVTQRPTLEELKSLPRTPISFILHNIRSLQNVGLFFRLADAIRAEKIYLTGYTGYPREEHDTRDERIIHHAEEEINKTAIKLVPAVPWEHREDHLDLLRELGKTYQIVAVEQTTESTNYQSAHYHFPLALVFGHERTGVEDEILTLADQVIEIPMLGQGNSHNVAVSATIIAYHLFSVLPKTKL